MKIKNATVHEKIGVNRSAVLKHHGEEKNKDKNLYCIKNSKIVQRGGQAV